MYLTTKGEFRMNAAEVADFSLWLDRNPKERYNMYNEVVRAYISFKNGSNVATADWSLSKAQ
jgi:hypothetical protein